MQNLIIVGAGGLGRELLQWVKDINAQSPRWHIGGFLADDPKALEGIACSHGVLGGVWDWQPGGNEVFTCAIGDPNDKAACPVIGLAWRSFRPGHPPERDHRRAQ